MFESPAKSEQTSPGGDMNKIQQLYVETKEVYLFFITKFI